MKPLQVAQNVIPGIFHYILVALNVRLVLPELIMQHQEVQDAIDVQKENILLKKEALPAIHAK